MNDLGTWQNKSDAVQPQQAMAERVRGDYLEFSAGITSRDAEAWRRKTCRACGKGGLHEVLNLGDMPPANSLLKPNQVHQTEARFPLSLQLCENCGMVQLAHVVPAPLLFRSYLFFTSSSRVMSEHFSSLMAEACEEFVRPGGLVVEIGSNDGTSLSSIRRRDVRVLGVDPARNIAVMAAARGVPTISEFFTETMAQEVARVAGQAQLIVACNVLGHIDDLDDVCAGIHALLAPGGALVIEVPYLSDLVARAEYDTIYHEHLSYFAVRPLATLFNRHGLRLERVKFFPVHGGTIRVTAIAGEGVSPQVQTWIDRENTGGLATRKAFEIFASRVVTARLTLRKQLQELHEQGLKVLGYGAPAKGTVVLNYCGIGKDLLPAVIDSTPAKQGWQVPGTHQPILPPEAMESIKPDVLLLLAWNHAAEIRRREAAFLARGGRIILPHAMDENEPYHENDKPAQTL
ncbi:MAG: class I SAM-dependent methyltransferase [Planctomycetota bacterium]|nr:class I SAM-dependent methyltransferase [Planctomycetota bacterium]